MLIRLVFLLFLVCTAWASVEDVEFLADKVSKNGEIIDAQGNIVVYSQKYLVTADRAKYDQNAQIIELYGNVNSIRGKDETARSKYAKINLQNNQIIANSAFAMDKNQEVWITGEESCSGEFYYETKNSVVSSCNVQDPDWRIKYTSGSLNKKSKFLHLWNPVFYVGEVPVFYLPYFGFSTDRTRRTGLLPPEIGVSRGDGLYYRQPFYVAEFNEWDLQFDPQIRTNRGYGLYTTFRFADSPYSRGLFRQGVFKERESYRQKENLKNSVHNGFEIEYDRDKLAKYLLEGNYEEGLWFRFTQLNDVDYINLKSSDSDEDSDSLVQSKLNYFMTTNKRYFGAYAKYYIDLSKIGTAYENDTTIQELPTFQYHEFLETIFTNNFTYSFDAKYHNYTRHKGVTATQYEFTAPFGFNFMLPGEWANFSATENIYASHVNYDENLAKFGGANDDYIRHYHEFTLQSDLSKAYADFFHTINLRLDYIKPGFKHGEIEPTLRSEDYDTDQDNFIGELDEVYTKENTIASLTQFFYDANGEKRIRHSVSQRYDLDRDTLGDLKHKINIYLGEFGLYNYFTYSNEFNDFTKIQSGINARIQALGLNLMHNYQKDYKTKDLYSRSSTIYGSASLNLPKQYSVFAGVEYDDENNYAKMWKIGLNHHRKCWNYSFVYRKDVEPKNTSAGPASKRTDGFYFMVGFYPFGGLDYDYSLERDNSGT